MLKPSPFILDWLPQIRTGGTLLDLACGRGRHARAALDAGLKVVAVDKDVSGVADLAEIDDCEIIEADLEGAPWPFLERTFDAIIVTNYLWRPLFRAIKSALVPGGLILYETFAVGNERYGKPSNPDFLLGEEELQATFADGFEELFYQHGYETMPAAAVKQRLAARKASDATKG